MPVTKLSHAFALTATCDPPKRKIDYYDDGTNCSGLVLEVRSSGSRTWHLRFQDKAGKQRQVKLARFEDATFDQVRKKARQLRSEVTLGGDPSAERAAAKAVPIYAELAAQHMADAKLHCRSYDTIEGYMRNHVVVRWGKVRLTDIDSRSVAHWLAAKEAEGLSPATVTKLKAILGRSFSLGAKWGVPGCERNPVRAVQTKPLNNERDRALSAEEAARLREACRASRNPVLLPIVNLLLATGCRLRELLDARLEHVDVERRSWFVPTSKNGRSRHVPLSGAALETIAGLPRYEGCPWLVPNPETLRPFVTIKNAWHAARDAAGLPGLRLHDCRHAAASALVSAGVDLYAVGRILGHRSVASSARYAHHSRDALLSAVEAGSAKLAAQPA